jgi:signal peptidase II
MGAAEMMKRKYYLITLLILAVDYVAKRIADAKLPGAPWDLIPGYLSLSYVTNSGVAFGFFADVQSGWKPYVLDAMAIIAVAIILIYSMHVSGNRKLLQAALAITMGGILGNLVDRVSHGFVIDFIDIRIPEVFHWPTFNIADSAITIGIALLLIDTVKSPALEKEKQPVVDSEQSAVSSGQ